MKKFAELERLYRQAPDKSIRRAIDSLKAAQDSSSPAETNASSAATHVDPETQVYGLIPELRSEETLSEGFLRRYESTAEKPDSSSPEASDLCQQLFKAGHEAGELIGTRSENLSCLNKSYSDAIE